jgi:hypothetical protein
VQASDPDGLARIDLHAVGAVTQPEQSQVVSGTSASATFTLTATADATPQTVRVSATVVDAVGSAAATGELTFDIVADLDAPVVTIALDPDRGTGGIYRPGEQLTVSASATDDLAVTELRLVVDGQEASSSGEPVSRQWTLPTVAVPTDYTLSATARDAEGNEGNATRTLRVDPTPADALPVVAFTCPTTGAVLPDDYVLALAATATDNAGVTAVRFYLGTPRHRSGWSQRREARRPWSPPPGPSTSPRWLRRSSTCASRRSTRRASSASRRSRSSG